MHCCNRAFGQTEVLQPNFSIDQAAAKMEGKPKFRDVAILASSLRWIHAQLHPSDWPRMKDRAMVHCGRCSSIVCVLLRVCWSWWMIAMTRNDATKCLPFRHSTRWAHAKDTSGVGTPHLYCGIGVSHGRPVVGRLWNVVRCWLTSWLNEWSMGKCCENWIMCLANDRFAQRDR